MLNPHGLSISDTVKEIESKNLSPVALAESLLDRIDKFDPDCWPFELSEVTSFQLPHGTSAVEL